MIRSFDSGIPVAIESVTRAMCGICVDDTSVYSPVAGVPYARQPRASIAFGIRRGCDVPLVRSPGAVSKIAWSPAPPWTQ